MCLATPSATQKIFSIFITMARHDTLAYASHCVTLTNFGERFISVMSVNVYFKTAGTSDGRESILCGCLDVKSNCTSNKLTCSGRPEIVIISIFFTVRSELHFFTFLTFSSARW